MTIAPSILAKYTDDLAFAAETSPAQTPAEFVTQLDKAAYNLGALARINGAEDLETASILLTEANDATGEERKVLLKRAIGYLKDLPDMVAEYRGMVGD
ncbi:hypothetical protein HUT11_35665 (plasmid) [Streptomyces seoulensis]|nr:hypothetical protein HUT11_35665 [Streptomyces seoulensis]